MLPQHPAHSVLRKRKNRCERAHCFVRTLKVVDPSHRSTRHLPIRWTRTDEWYDFRSDLDRDITVLIRIDEATYRVEGWAQTIAHRRYT